MKLINRFALVAGAGVFAALGRDRFYMAMQGKGPFSGLMRWFAGHKDLEWLTRNWKHVLDEGQNPRINKATVAHYLEGDDLGGWSAENQTWGDMHNPLPEQMRGVIFPALERRLAEGDVRTVVEVGSSNGDVLAHFANRFPDVKFVGADFAVPSKHQAPNLRFVKGYALELLEDGSLKGDLLFASSTFCLPGPVEMRAYAEAIAAAGFRTVLIQDPVTRAYDPDRYPGESRHQTFGMWGHDHRAIFGAVGYRVTSFERFDYVKHRSGKVQSFQIVRLDRA